MANSNRIVSAPNFGTVPSIPENPKLENYLKNLINELNRFHVGIIAAKADKDLVATVAKQQLTDNFTIRPEARYIEIRSDSPITSEADVAIKEGEHGQTITLENTGDQAITLKDNANTKLGGDITLDANSAVTLRYSTNTQQWSRQAQQVTN